MTEFQKQCLQAENLVNALFRVARDNPEALTADCLESLETISKLAEKLAEEIRKPAKEALEFNLEYISGNKKFYYKKTESRVFDAEKAKSTLESLEYSLQDFEKVQTRKTLLFTTI